MKSSVVAVVISHDEPNYFSATLSALKNQSRTVDQIFVVDTSTSNECVEIARQFGVSEIHQLPATTTLANSVGFAVKNLSANSEVLPAWIWLLHDDSAPEVDALKNLLAAVELSPSVAIAGPKLVDWNDPRVVNQLGLTLTPLGDLFSLVSGELDQSQHDDSDDVMAVGTAAALIRFDVMKDLGGFDTSAPELAVDFDFSIRTRMAGHRVVVVPQARVAHASLSMHGKRPKSWLDTSPKAALRRSAIHLRLAFSPLPVTLLFWFFLPVIGFARAIGRIAAKRPDRIWIEISAAFWGFFTIGRRLSSRSEIAKHSVVKFSKLKALRATWQQVRNSNRAALEQEQSEATLAAFERGEFEVEQSAASGFVSSGALWVAATLAALSFSYWPTGVAGTGGGLLPLSDSWVTLFSRAGASFQPIGLGYFGPSDPFVWVLTALGSLTFWAPSLSLAVLLLLAKSIAFAGAWRVIALFSESTFVRISASLVFAFWPALELAQREARIPAMIAQLALPWLVFSIARAAGIGKANFSTQTWSWVAVSGLLLFVVSAAAPNTIPISLTALALIILSRIRKIVFLIWIPLPTAAVFGPTVIYYLFGIAKPLALLADPGLPMQSDQVPIWQLMLGGSSFGLSLPFVGQFANWVVVPILLIALLSLVGKRWSVAFVFWVAAITTVAIAWLVSSLSFVAVGVGSTVRSTDFVNGSPSALLGLFGLLVAILFALGLNEIKMPAARKVIASALAVVSLLPTLFLVVTAGTNLKYTDGRVVPSIVAAEAEQGSALKMLVINPEVNADGSIQFGAEVVSGDGVQLEDVSLSYRFALDGVKQTRQAEYNQIAQLVADLASANGTDLQATIDQVGIGYVLVPDRTSKISGQLSVALNSVKELEAVGSTDSGQLWRVREPNQELLNAGLQPNSPWSITKGVQLAVLLGFVLLAIPTFNQRRRVSGDSQIFVEAGEEN
jgi:GT2 family glycosyltransferase